MNNKIKKQLTQFVLRELYILNIIRLLEKVLSLVGSLINGILASLLGSIGSFVHLILGGIDSILSSLLGSISSFLSLGYHFFLSSLEAFGQFIELGLLLLGELTSLGLKLINFLLYLLDSFYTTTLNGCLEVSSGLLNSDGSLCYCSSWFGGWFSLFFITTTCAEHKGCSCEKNKKLFHFTKCIKWVMYNRLQR